MPPIKKNTNGEDLMFTDILKDKRGKQVLLRLTVAEKDVLAQLAAGSRLRLTSYLRRLIRRARDAAAAPPVKAAG